MDIQESGNVIYGMAYPKLEENRNGKGTGKREKGNQGQSEEKSGNYARTLICIDTETQKGEKLREVENENEYLWR